MRKVPTEPDSMIAVAGRFRVAQPSRSVGQENTMPLPTVGVEVTVPDLGPIKIDVPPGGAFYHVAGKTTKVTRVGREKH